MATSYKSHTTLVVFAGVFVAAVFCFYVLALTDERPNQNTSNEDRPTVVLATTVEASAIKNEQDPIPPIDVLKKMSPKDLCDFFHGYIHSVQTLCNRRVRMGKINDGGWDLCEDPKYKPDPTSCLVYSYGIARDWSYDVEMINFGCEVHSYDPSLGDLDPSTGEKFVFHKTGLGGQNTTWKRWTLHTLAKDREVKNHMPSQRRLDVVKMDIEGAEMGGLKQALKEGSLKDVRQLAFEIHIPRRQGYPKRTYALEMLQLLRGLWKEGFRLYFTNRNISPVNIYKGRLDGKAYSSCYELHMLKAQ